MSASSKADREGLTPDDYDGLRWSGRLGTTSSGRALEPDLIRFDLAVTISTMRYISDLNRGRLSPRDFHFDLDVGNKNIDLSKFLRQKLVWLTQEDVEGDDENRSMPPLSRIPPDDRCFANL